jgi:lipopolysaccharide transport system ATP-binding protein
MSDIAIKFENISKQYRLGNIGTGTLSHDLNRWWAMNIRGKEDPNLKIGQVNDRATKSTSDYVWALRDIDFEVKQGEVLGIIGKNGAGKSTLLKILSRVTSPTTGRIMAHGRIASLLEVGTGFHPEMTGRENIYMNGAIMGMTKAEITRKLDEIIDFAGVEKYIDTPVKRYSSGMTVRLGFAIAAHLEPEILVVDEVLAVGDAEFQKKAIGKMQDVSRNDGRTVLFVSHNLAAVKSLCKNGIIINNGTIINSGSISLIIENYVNINITINEKFKGFADLTDRKNQYNSTPLFKTISVQNRLNKTTNVIPAGEQVKFKFQFSEKIDFSKNIGIGIYFNKRGERILGHTSFMSKEPGNFNSTDTIEVQTEPLRLLPGRYQIEIVLVHKGVQRLDYIENIGDIKITENDVFGNGEILDPAIGYSFLKGNWKI